MDNPTPVEEFIDRRIGDELKAGESIVARAYLHNPATSKKPRTGGSGILALRVLGMIGLGFAFGGGGRGRPLSYFGALTNRRLLVIETERRGSGSRPDCRAEFQPGSG